MTELFSLSYIIQHESYCNFYLSSWARFKPSTGTEANFTEEGKNYLYSDKMTSSYADTEVNGSFIPKVISASMQMRCFKFQTDHRSFTVSILSAPPMMEGVGVALRLV